MANVRKMLAVVVAVGLMGFVGAANAEVIYTGDFETGKTWGFSHNFASIYKTSAWAENGPSLPGTKCMLMKVTDGTGSHSNSYISGYNTRTIRALGADERTFSIDWDVMGYTPGATTDPRVFIQLKLNYTDSTHELHAFSEDMLYLNNLTDHEWTAVTGSQWTATETKAITDIQIKVWRYGIGNTNSWTKFDNIRLNVIPEPATLCLLVVGGIGILVRRKARS